MAVKYINLQFEDTGLTVYARIQQESSGNWYDPASGEFDAYVEADVISLAEDVNVKRKYSWSGGDSVIWIDGRYYVYVYKQVGGSPDDDNDEAIGSGSLIIQNDKELDEGDILALLDNKYVINESTSELWVYNAGGDTVIKKYPLTDKDGNSIILQGTGPANRGVRSL
jgi:hypothetical protein